MSKPRIVGVSLALAAAAAVGACADSRGGPIPYNVPLGAPDPTSIAPLESDYKIAPLDKLTVKIGYPAKFETYDGLRISATDRPVRPRAADAAGSTPLAIVPGGAMTSMAR